MDPSTQGDDFPFGAVFLVIALGFVFVAGLFILRAVQGAQQWSKNNNSPVLSRRMRVVTKRADVTTNQQIAGDGVGRSPQSTTRYFVTVEDPESRDREEFRVNGKQFGMLAEGDVGTLTSQGNRFQGSVRE